MNSTDWSKLSFSYLKTNTIIVSIYREGRWSPLESRRDDNIGVSALSASLHYGIQAFEGLKAFRGIDGKVRLFRPVENALRLKRSAGFLGIESPPEEFFLEACLRAVRENIEYLPPYEFRASMYIRPFLIGIGPQIDLVSSKEVMFIVAVMPVGSFSGSVTKPVKALLASDHDRAAPMGTGSYKIGGNYAAAMLSCMKAKKEGYSAVLYLDSKRRRYIEEFSSSNFFGIKENTYITPDSPSVLPSITNKSLLQLAYDSGMKTERRKIPYWELADFEEVGACGTAVVITPVSQIDDRANNLSYITGKSDRAGEKSHLLYKNLTAIQYGEMPDIHNWCIVL